MVLGKHKRIYQDFKLSADMLNNNEIDLKSLKEIYFKQINLKKNQQFNEFMIDTLSEFRNFKNGLFEYSVFNQDGKNDRDQFEKWFNVFLIKVCMK